MNNMNRPEYITIILEKMASADDPSNHESIATLEAYIVDLEANQVDRPAWITSILESDASSYSPGTIATLDAYITDLESKQEIVLPDASRIPETNSKRSPLWALRRRIQLERRRRIQLDRKRHTSHRDD